MKTLRMAVDFTYDEALMHNGDDDEEAKDWFFDYILKGGNLQLADFGDIGDMLGDLNIVEIEGVF